MMYSPQQRCPTDFGTGEMFSQSRISRQHMPQSGLDALAQSSQYALRQLQQQQQQQQPQELQSLRENAMTPLKQRQSFDEMAGVGAESAGGTIKTRTANGSDQKVRRRISRACDQCNQLRTKCDGKAPCAHCVELGLTCEYARERKKRGKASRKDIAAQQAAAATSAVSNSGIHDTSPLSAYEIESDEPGSDTASRPSHDAKRRRSDNGPRASQLPLPWPSNITAQHPGSLTNGSPQDAGSFDGQDHGAMAMDRQTPGASLPTPRLPSVGMPERNTPSAVVEYGTIDDYHRGSLHPEATMTGDGILHGGASAMSNPMLHSNAIGGYDESGYGVPSSNNHQGIPGAPYRIGETSLSTGFLGQSPPMAGSPGWLSLPSPSGALYPGLQHAAPGQTLRYPVLRPLLSHISAIIPIGLACDLLELYFSTTSSAFMHPQSPYVHGYIFRKNSFLRPNNPRPCSPALLASMLWVAAQTSESAFLTSTPSARGKICQKLLELTIGLLKPLIHTPTDATSLYGGGGVINGIALGGFGVALQGHAHEMNGGSPGAAGVLDDVATYLHLATVVSASEYKAASLRWWNAAWTLARELKLGRELPPNTERQDDPDIGDGQVDANGQHVGGGTQPNNQHHGDHPIFVPQEEREERRRIWWLLYIVDRHLALCYNRPLFLLDAECEGLLHPESDAIWQAGEYYSGENNQEPSYLRLRGPSFECTGHGIFGYFLPMMTILGEIVDLNQARNHPRFGLSFRSGSEWDGQAREISEHLETYGRSLKDFEAQHIQPPLPQPPLPPQHPTEPNQTTERPNNGDGNHLHPITQSTYSAGTNQLSQRLTESMLQTRIVVAYGTHLMHTMHVLLNGKWDPISLLDDNDLWISSQSFVSATGHAVSAAEAIDEILDYDPDLSFTPFFFGIYLLQGSFLLLLMADKLQGEASPNIVKACEAIVRAHEACVVTLNTEYQRNFRKVMRSALAQVKGRMAEDRGEQQLRRREVLSLYRWTGEGTGLAL